MGRCWACDDAFPAEAIWYDENGDPWPLCMGHLALWLSYRVSAEDVEAAQYISLDSYVTEESARGIAEIENMLRGTSNG